MNGQTPPRTVGALTETTDGPPPRTPAVLTRLVWLLWVGSLLALGGRLWTGSGWELPGLVAVDGLTVVMWTVVTFVSGVVHSYSRRYMAGTRDVSRFFARTFAFTLVVLVLVAADHALLFVGAWLAMGLVMADLIGHARGWRQARAAAGLARRYFVASSLLVAVALATLWATTGATTLSGMVTAVDGVPGWAWLVVAGALVLAATVQSALLPFHGWLLSSMTAPTPASALMHAGFVNAGGILLTRFAPVLTADADLLLAVVVVGAVSALAGKLLKTVHADVKGQLGSSTVGQMGFMIMQAGLGFFGAAITHLILHGFYKAYLFLSSGEGVERRAPTADSEAGGASTPGVVGAVATLLTALAGGAVFVALTGKGTSVDSGLLLTLLVVVTTLHAARGAVGAAGLPASVRYGVVPLVFLPAIAVYAAVFEAVTALVSDLPVVTAPAELTVVHAAVAAAFLVAYAAVDTGVYRRSDRLYVALLNVAQAAPPTVLTAREEYNEY